MLLLPSRRSFRRPSGVPRLNLGSQFAPNLKGWFVPGPWGARNFAAVNPLELAVSGTVSIAGNPQGGLAAQVTASNSGYRATTPDGLKLQAYSANGGQGITLALWMRFLGTPTDLATLGGVSYNSTVGSPYYVYAMDTGTTRVPRYHASTNGGLLTITGSTVATGVDTLLVLIVRNTSPISIVGYQNGVQVASGSGSVTLQQYDSTSQVAIGDFWTTVGRNPNMLGWDMGIWAEEFSAGKVAALYDPATRWDLYWQPSRRAYFQVGGAGYTLTAGTGAFSLTGVAAGVTAQRKLTADAQSYTLTGVAASLSYGRTMTADVGAFTLTGVATGLTAARKLTADAQSYALTGVAAGLTAARSLSASVGAFTLSGVDAGLSYSGATGYTLTAAAGAFVLTGVAAGLVAARSLATSTASFTLTGNSASFSPTMEEFVDEWLRISRAYHVQAASYRKDDQTTEGNAAIADALSYRNLAVVADPTFTAPAWADERTPHAQYMAFYATFPDGGGASLSITDLIAQARQFHLDGITAKQQRSTTRAVAAWTKAYDALVAAHALDSTHAGSEWTTIDYDALITFYAAQGIP